MPITSVESLRQHLQTAIELEHTTLPPYLCALYSIHPGTNLQAAAVIRSVIMEEMLHMTLAANLLNAIDGEPCINQGSFVPTYPGFLPHSDRKIHVSLLKFGRPALEQFLQIENPAPPCAPPQDDNYKTIGQFYEAIREGFCQLHNQPGHDLFCGKPERQIGPDTWYYGGGGRVVKVHDLPSALLAIQEIEAQGEGLAHGIADGDQELFGLDKQVAHYFRFNEVYLGRAYREGDTPAGGPSGPAIPVDWSAVYNMRANPHTHDYSDRPDIAAMSHEFDCLYSSLLDILHESFNGNPQQMLKAAPYMYLLKDKATALMKVPSGDGDTTVGPGFRFVPKERRQNLAFSNVRQTATD